MDGAGGVYVSGYTGGAFSGQTSAGGYDAFVAKFDGSAQAKSGVSEQLANIAAAIAKLAEVIKKLLGIVD